MLVVGAGVPDGKQGGAPLAISFLEARLPFGLMLEQHPSSLERGPDTQRESPKVRGIADLIEQAERGAIRKSPQAHQHFCPLPPTAIVFVSYGFVLFKFKF